MIPLQEYPTQQLLHQKPKTREAERERERETNSSIITIGCSKNITSEQKDPIQKNWTTKNITKKDNRNQPRMPQS